MKYLIIIIYLSVALIAVAFTVLVVYIMRVLKSLKGTVDNVALTLSGLEKQMQGITTESTELLQKTNALAGDIQRKSERLDSVVIAVEDIGTTVQQFNQSVKRISTTVTSNLENKQEKMNQTVQWGNIAITLWKKWKSKKKKNEK